MARTNIDIDEDACAAVMHKYGLTTKREAVNLALRSLAREIEPMTPDEIRAFLDRGMGWDGDLAAMRGDGSDPWG